MVNPLEQSVASAVRSNADIGKLFARIGTKDHPRGFVQSAYRNANRAMRTALKEGHPDLAAMDVMNQLKQSVRSEVVSLFLDAEHQGADEAARQLRFYGIESNPGTLKSPRAAASVEAITTRIDAQAASIQALILTGASDEQIVGSDQRAGVLRPSDISILAGQIAASLLWSSYGSWVDDYSGGQEFQKQAVAALDEHTTDCCLKVHSQIQPLDGLFELTGTPRFADHMDWSPFHIHCRTSIALFQDEYDMGLTDKMRAGADKIMRERAAGGSGERNPANAYA